MSRHLFWVPTFYISLAIFLISCCKAKQIWASAIVIHRQLLFAFILMLCNCFKRFVANRRLCNFPKQQHDQTIVVT